MPKLTTRDKIVLAAGSLAAESGIDSVNAEGLAERAGTSRRTIFNYFASASDAVYEYLGQYVAEKVAQADRSIDTASTLTEYLSSLEDLLVSPETFDAIAHLDRLLGTCDNRSVSHDWLAHTSHVTIQHLTGSLTDRFDLPKLDIAIIGATIVSTLHSTHMIWSNMTDRSADQWTRVLQRSLVPLRSLASFDTH